jgi:hypothetical protein
MGENKGALSLARKSRVLTAMTAFGKEANFFAHSSVHVVIYLLTTNDGLARIRDGGPCSTDESLAG